LLRACTQGRFWNAWYPGDCGFWDALSEGAGAAIEQAVSEQTTTPNIWKLIGLLNDGVRRGLLVRALPPNYTLSTSSPIIVPYLSGFA
jgi:hypothetical protein